MSIFDNLTKSFSNFLDFGNNEQDLNSLSYEELLKKVSLINSENTSLQNSISEISKENYLLDNSIVNDNNKNNSEFSKFLNLMQINLLNNKNSNDIHYSNNDFKNFLYKEKMFYGCLDENDVNFLIKAKKDNKLEWDDKKKIDKNKLKQEILEKNLKNLYSNIFSAKVKNKKFNNDKSKNINKIEEKKEKEINNNNINNINLENNENKKKGKIIFDENIFSNINNNNMFNNKKNEEVNILEELIYNEDKDNDKEI